MKVKLKELKPNPFRDFNVDPIDDEAVKELTESIKDHDFWGGIVCRKTKEGIEIAAGHRRWKAALAASIEIADLFVGDLDNEAMIRIYARENATQRGNTGAAITGSVASAAKYLIKAILKDDDKLLSQICDSKMSLGHVRETITSEKGIGAPIIARFLAGVPDMKESVIAHQLANLKASGDYARIVKEVSEEIEQECTEAEAELEQLQKEAERTKEESEKKAAEKARASAQTKAKQRAAAAKNGQKATQIAEETPITWDFSGVSKHLKNEHHLRVFREMVTGPYVQPYLAIDKQALLAQKIVEQSKVAGQELTGEFIRRNLVQVVIDAKAFGRILTKQQLTELEATDRRMKCDRMIWDFCRSANWTHKLWGDITELIEENQTVTFEFSNSFYESLKNLKSITKKEIDELLKVKDI